MSAPKYYPSLSSVFNFDLLPEPLGFLRDAGNSILDKILIKRKDIVVNSNGDTYSILITLVVYNSLRFEIPGTGLALIMNPPQYEVEPGVSEFTISMEVKYPLLRYLGKKKIANLLLDPAEIFEFALSLLGVSLEELYFRAVQIHSYDGLPQSLVDKVNQHYSLSPQIPPVPASELNMTDIQSIIQAIGTHPQLISQNTTVYDVLFDLYVMDSTIGDSFTDNVDRLFYPWMGGSATAIIKKMLLPKIVGALHLGLALEIPRNILLPLDNTTLEPLTVPDPNNPPKTLLLFAQGDFTFSTDEGFGFDSEISLTLIPLYSSIGKTGLIIGFTKAKLDLSRTKNLPEADEDGRPPDFIGIYVLQLDIILPKKWFKEENGQTLKISGKRLLIGTGGISGTVEILTINNTPPQNDDYFWFKLGTNPNKSWRLGFNKFDITFHQNVVTASNIKGALEIPRFKSGNDPLRIDLEGHLAEDGDFSLTASITDGIHANLFNFVHFNFFTFELGREEDNFFIGTSCDVWFTNAIMTKLLGDQKIKLPRVRIYSNGRFEIVGGNAFIPVNLSLHLGPIDIAVTGITFGSYQQEHNGHQRKYNYFGFDGSINLGPLGVEAKGKGVKYYYSVDDDEPNGAGGTLGHHSFIRVQTIEIDLIIPGSANPASAIAIIHGAVSIPEPGESPEYYGEVSLKLPKAKIAGGAAMRLQPKAPAFIVDAFVDLPAPIPLGPVGIYGFRGLIGYRYVAEKEAVGLVSGVNTWYEYYTHPPKGIHINKFSGPERTKEYSFPFSIGAGAVLGTSFDSGTIISIRAMLLLSIPTLFMIEGRASILSARLGLTDSKEPPFFAFIAFGDHSLELGIGADFQLPQSNGWILDLYAEVQAGFFFNNPSRWYVNFGTKQQPISARVLTILTAQTYLMLSAKGIEAGARVEFNLDKHFGPARVHIYAYVEVGGRISFERPQIGGYLALGGMIDIQIWIVGLTIGLDALLSVEAAKPFLLYAELRIRVCVRIIVKVCKSFTIQLKWEKDSSVNRDAIEPLPPATATLPTRRQELIKAVSMLTNEPFTIKFFGNVPGEQDVVDIIPMDSFIDIKVPKGLIPNAVDEKIGGHTTGAENFTDLISPESTSRSGRQLRQVKHTYSIESIEIKAWNGAQWVDYHPYRAIINDDDVLDLKIGYWQRSGNQYDTIRLLATTPFSYTQPGEPGWFIPEQYGINPSTLFCAMDKLLPHCSNVLNKPIGTIYYPPQQYFAHYINGAYYTITGGTTYDPSNPGINGLNGDYMKVTGDANPFGFAKSLAFNNYNSLVIFLPEPSVSGTVRMTTNAPGADISYYKKIINDATSAPQYELLQTVHKTSLELAQPLDFNNMVAPVSKIVITPALPNPRIAEINAEIAALFNTTYENSSGQVTITQPINLAAYQALLSELAELTRNGCASDSRFFFTNFYGYLVSSNISQSSFKHFIRFGDYYLATINLLLIDDNFGGTTSLLLKIDGNGQVVAEKFITGVINSICIINGEILMSLAKRYAISTQLELPRLIRLDASLNQVGAMELSPLRNSVNDQIIPIGNTKYLFWFASNFIDRAAPVGAAFDSGSRILLIDTQTMSILDMKMLDSDFFLKGVPKGDDGCIFITQIPVVIGTPPGLITVRMTPTLKINIETGHFADNSIELLDIVLSPGGVPMITGRFWSINLAFVGYADYSTDPVRLYTYSGSALSAAPLHIAASDTQEGSIRATVYHGKGAFLIAQDANNFIIKKAFKIVKPGTLTGPDIGILNMSNNRDTNEVYMISGEGGYYKGAILTIMDEELNSCLLPELDVAKILNPTVFALTKRNVPYSIPQTLFYGTGNMVSPTQYILVNQQLCPPAPQPVSTVRCTTSLQQLCWLTVAQEEYNITIPAQAAIQEDHSLMVEAMQRTAQPVWRPNTKFYVHFQLKDSVDNGSNNSRLYNYYYGFRTTGPVGHYVPPGTNANHPLASLRQYIDYNRSYPNADGNLLQAKPLFYGNDQCKISVFFAHPYAYHLLQTWMAYNGLPELTGEMHIAIKDPVTDVIVPYPLPVAWTHETVPLPTDDETWTDDNDPRIPHNIQMLNNMVDYVNGHLDHIHCLLTIGAPIKPKAYTYSVTLTNLAPRKLYTALLYNAFEASNNNVVSNQIHEFVFQTSRYASFEEQVNSYKLKDDDNNERPAVFKIPITVTAAKINTAWNIINNQSDPQSDALQTKYMHEFDRITEGLFGFIPNDPAVTTEFNLLQDTVTHDVIALLVRNPEPFNIPKMPLSDVKDTIAVLGQGALPDDQYQVFYSKDYAQAIIMHTSKKITAPGLSFRFIYKTWNGTAYTPASTLITSPVALNI